ncbi:hypothetical protein QTP88_002042 [Uroleucon formosanum]
MPDNSNRKLTIDQLEMKYLSIRAEPLPSDRKEKNCYICGHARTGNSLTLHKKTEWLPDRKNMVIFSLTLITSYARFYVSQTTIYGYNHSLRDRLPNNYCSLHLKTLMIEQKLQNITFTSILINHNSDLEALLNLFNSVTIKQEDYPKYGLSNLDASTIFINGIIEFDQKVAPLSSYLPIPQRSWKKIQWNLIFISLIAYFIGFKIAHLYLNPMKIISIKLLIHHVLFTIPYIMDFVVVISSCFFLQNMYVRFQTLNDVWKCLPANLVPISVQWTHIDIVVLMEDMRLLHAELCDLLKMFTLGYGPMLLSFFISSYINMLLSIYIFIQNDEVNHFRITERVYKQMLTLSIYAQSFTFLMSIITFISFINEKRLEMISYLRLYRISNLHLDVKRQIKMFMNQISVYDSDQISAFGFFNINLNLVTSLLVLLVSGTITLIQMKDHPIIMKLNNDTVSFFQSLGNRTYNQSIYGPMFINEKTSISIDAVQIIYYFKYFINQGVVLKISVTGPRTNVTRHVSDVYYRFHFVHKREGRQIAEKNKNKVCLSNDNPQKNIANSQITPGVAGNIPAIPFLKRTMKNTSEKQNVLQNPSSILIYSTEENRKLMEKSKH